MASTLLPPVCLLANQMSLVDLEALQAHVASLISGLTEKKLMTPTQIRKEVINLAADKSKSFKAGWRKLVMQSGVVENVFGILEECYPSLRAKDRNEDGWKAARELGGRDTAKWQEFKLCVVRHLYEKGSFGSPEEEGGFHDFEDTACGCDEIAWDAACDLLSGMSSATITVTATATATVTAPKPDCCPDCGSTAPTSIGLHECLPCWNKKTHPCNTMDA